MDYQEERNKMLTQIFSSIADPIKVNHHLGQALALNESYFEFSFKNLRVTEKDDVFKEFKKNTLAEHPLIEDIKLKGIFTNRKKLRFKLKKHTKKTKIPTN